MSVDFFQAKYQSRTTEKLFGICDNQDGQKAFIDKANQDKWIATVKNDKNSEILFNAIDNCIDILRDNGKMDDNRCDGMLTYENNIVFIELKDKMKRWIPDAINQLKTTIEHFISNHDISVYQHKRAFAVNKQRPHFNYGNQERSQRFFGQYRVRLNIQATIKI